MINHIVDITDALGFYQNQVNDSDNRRAGDHGSSAAEKYVHTAEFLLIEIHALHDVEKNIQNGNDNHQQNEPRNIGVSQQIGRDEREYKGGGDKTYAE